MSGKLYGALRIFSEIVAKKRFLKKINTKKKKWKWGIELQNNGMRMSHTPMIENKLTQRKKQINIKDKFKEIFKQIIVSEKNKEGKRKMGNVGGRG